MIQTLVSHTDYIAAQVALMEKRPDPRPGDIEVWNGVRWRCRQMPGNARKKTRPFLAWMPIERVSA